MNDIPRRVRVDQFTPAEKAIYDALAAVEPVGAHPLLTMAVIKLGDARSFLADYVDGKRYDPTLGCPHGSPFGQWCGSCSAASAPAVIATEENRNG